MDYVFLSSIFNMNDYEKLRKESKVPLGLADHNLNLNLIVGIEENIKKPVKLINNVQIPNYPLYPRKLFFRQEWHHVNDGCDVNCGFINLPLIKHLSRAQRTYSEINSLIKNHGIDNLCLITYDLHFGISLAVSRITRKYPALKTCLFMPDMPTAVIESSSAGKMGIKDIVMARLKALFIDSYKSFVFITKQMVEVVDTKGKPYVIVEGIYNSNDTELRIVDGTKKIILYTGQLNPVYGLSNLLKAYIKITKERNDFELWLCGSGDMVEEINQLSVKYPGIKYFGYCNIKEIREKQEKATVLINPRQNIGDYTKYSFPSKTMEYLASGRPMIGYKLDGIPTEYDEYICYVKDNSIEALKDKILEICLLSYDRRMEIGRKARNFIINKKNPKIQCKKLVSMLEMM